MVTKPQDIVLKPYGNFQNLHNPYIRVLKKVTCFCLIGNKTANSAGKLYFEANKSFPHGYEALAIRSEALW